MPQMAPLSWLILFMMFSITFMMFNTVNYYSTMMAPPKTQQLDSLSTTPMSWKW